MMAQGYRQNGKIVEFALVLSSGRLPQSAPRGPPWRRLLQPHGALAAHIAMLQNEYVELEPSAGDIRGTLAGLRQTTEPPPREGSGRPRSLAG